MARPCHLRHPEPRPDDCRLCWLYVHRADYRARFDDQQTHTLPGIPRSPACRHLGPYTGQRGCCPDCPGAPGEDKIPLMACAVHGTCTPFWPGVGAGCCLDCPDYEPLAEG